jgi:hypothetical protein
MLHQVVMRLGNKLSSHGYCSWIISTFLPRLEQELAGLGNALRELLAEATAYGVAPAELADQLVRRGSRPASCYSSR